METDEQPQNHIAAYIEEALSAERFTTGQGSACGLHLASRRFPLVGAKHLPRRSVAL